MADQSDDTEKTEEPTSKKLEDAHKKGDVAKSQEVNTWFVMLGACITAGFLSPGMAAKLSHFFEVFIASPHDIPMDAQHLRMLWMDIGTAVLLSLALPMAVLMAGALAGNVLQHKPIFTTEKMKPKLNKISPLQGFKRLFSLTSLVNFTKGIVKICIVGVVTFVILWPERDRLAVMVTYEVSEILPLVQMLTIRVSIGVLAVLGVLAGLDYLYERFQWMKKQRMSIQEIKDEYKQMEGDPTVKAKLRQLRMERGRKRMMAAVPEASVVIANPTHYAIALKYEQGMAAPLVLAKGIDAVALKIREIAEAHEIPVVVNPPLARALHATVEIDEEIPPEHYRAVAEVIGYVMRLKAKMSWRTRRT
ncbi:flagellar biosynthetic protein FlhB [Tepidicaulis marinus]|uniref:Flagellar biosynthetic protein FlhB n=1 Tax=Tepidicaulis marinus TaxID=1333998 RepID=A0A081B9K1_9HYPH|nr:flagellar biosynthesis protein FlhB [Tepidicaulis marinus]GAK44719.1 flagellar biosynthetic protein FlhB [Tepidicaulis marinus]